jgi:hypothetical protein
MRTSSALKFYATRFSGQCVALRAALRRRYGLVPPVPRTGYSAPLGLTSRLLPCGISR